MLANISNNKSDQHVGTVCSNNQHPSKILLLSIHWIIGHYVWFRQNIRFRCSKSKTLVENVGQHVGAHRKSYKHAILTCFLQICWPTFLRFLRNVGQHFSLIFSFSNMFVHKANQTNMLANMLVCRCWSKFWPTCCSICAGLYKSSDKNGITSHGTFEISYFLSKQSKLNLGINLMF